MTGSPASLTAESATDRTEWERSVVLRHRYGDQQAFDEVYREFAPMVYNLTLRMSGSPERAQDLSQEVFLRVFRSLGRFKGKSSLKTWVYRITVNHCRSKLGRRRLPTESLVDGEGRERELIDPRRDPEERAMSGATRSEIRQALLGVEPVYREALILRDLEELTYQEIAEVLKVRLGTVRSRIARGRAQLKLSLEKSP